MRLFSNNPEKQMVLGCLYFYTMIREDILSIVWGFFKMAVWLADSEMRHTNRFPDVVNLDRAPNMWLKTSFGVFVPDFHPSHSSPR